MRNRSCRLSLIAMIATVCGFASGAQAASVEALLAEINKLPPAQRQKRLEDGARREGAFKFYGISQAALLTGLRQWIHEKVSVH